MLRHSTSFVRSRWKASMSSMQISRFSCHSSLRKLHRTCFLGVYYIYKTWPLQLKVQYKTSLMGSTFYLFIVNYLILVVHSRFYSFMGLFIIWKAISSHQIKKNDNWTKKKTNKNDVNDQKWHFAQANEIAALGFVALSDHILALGFYLCKYKSIFTDVLWQSF